ncbi:capsid protein [Peromfec virus RodF5_39]|uniref:Capsid protein n=1 Tax=Peromfec virus RodF5_39 TaxID=2929280 RepID=A0A976R7E2_9VIRU|nr:capsid protein [Peromfec virus RodF5_39]
MAYKRYTKRRAAPRKKTPYRRRSYAKKPRYAKRATMSKKRVLNVVSRKKRNGMLSWANTAPNGVTVNAISQTPAYVSAAAVTDGTACGIFLWNCTAMSLNANQNGGNTVINQAERTSTTCYMRGLAEHLRIQTSTGLPWIHRRLVFNLKIALAYQNLDTAPVAPQQTYVDTSNGIERLWQNLAINKTPKAIGQIYAYLFRGTYGTDYTDPLIAPVATDKVTVMYDKTRTYKSGNTAGYIGETKLWHGINKNLVYDDDELGAGMNPSYISVTGKPGVGNVFVLDILAPGVGGSSGDIIRIDANSTLYWHER